MATPTTENGWTAVKKPLGRFVAPNGWGVMVRDADAAVVFDWAADQWQKIEPIRIIGGWRDGTLIAGTQTVSNHAAGLATDTDWDKHPYRFTAGRNYRDTFTKAQIARVLAINTTLQEMVGTKRRLIRSGYEYRWERTDGMHLEWYSDAAMLRKAAEAIREETKKPVDARSTEWNDGVLKLGDRGPDTRRLQLFLLNVFSSYADPIKDTGGADGVFGKGTAAVVGEFQRRSGLDPDQVVGRRTLQELARYRWAPKYTGKG